MGTLSWIILGIVAAWATSRVTRHTEPRDYLLNIVVGVIGAFAGGFSANLVGRDPVFGFTLTSFFVAMLGTVVFLVILFGIIQRR